MRVICMLTTLVLLVVLASCSGKGETSLSYEQFRQKVESLQTGQVYRPLAKYRDLLGQPEKEQEVKGDYILYYRVREGRVQIILDGTPQMGYAVQSFNLW